ncbi:hypothetical protein CapIbe_011729 [Capra ibex]
MVEAQEAGLQSQSPDCNGTGDGGGLQAQGLGTKPLTLGPGRGHLQDPRTQSRKWKMEEPNRPAFPAKPILHVQAVWFGVRHLPSLSPTVLTCKVVLNIPTKGP